MSDARSQLQESLDKVGESLRDRAQLDEDMVARLVALREADETRARQVEELTGVVENTNTRVSGFGQQLELFGERLARIEAVVLYSKPWMIILTIVGFIVGCIVTATIIAGVGDHSVTVLRNGVQHVVTRQSDLSGTARWWLEVFGGLVMGILFALIGSFVPAKAETETTTEEAPAPRRRLSLFGRNRTEVPEPAPAPVDPQLRADIDAAMRRSQERQEAAAAAATVPTQPVAAVPTTLAPQPATGPAAPPPAQATANA